VTERQKRLLQIVLDEYMKTAHAVGSLGLNNKYGLRISSATIRNEMADLCDQGFLRKDHSSSGRIPTTLAWRYFIEEMLEELEELNPVMETEFKEKIFQNRFNPEALYRESARALATMTGNASVIIANKAIYYSGLSNILDEPELQDIERLKALLTLLENYPILSEIFNKLRGNRNFRVLIEEEIGLKSLDKLSIIYTDIKGHNGEKGYIAILGPSRMNYARTFPALESIVKHINHSMTGWR